MAAYLLCGPGEALMCPSQCQLVKKQPKTLGDSSSHRHGYASVRHYDYLLNY